MKFLLDENLPNSTQEIFKEFKYEVEHIRFTNLRGASDKEIAEYAKESNAILVTKDLEFGSILLYPLGSHYGLIILKTPSSYTISQINETMWHFLKNTPFEKMVNAINIIQQGKYRRRELA